MNINLVRLAGVTRALVRIASAIERHNELTELAMNTEGITTQIRDMKPAELKDTEVEYPDASVELMIRRLESEGHVITEKDRETVRQFLSEDDLNDQDDL